MSLAFCLINLLAIIVYAAVTMAMFKPVHVGLSLGLWIFIAELTVFTARKCEQNNFSFKQFEAIVCMVAILILFGIWLLVLLTQN